MDPLTAFTLLATEITKLVTVIVEGQTPEQKKIIWDWYIADMKFWRSLFASLTGPSADT
jgi:hypothetical protein